MFESADLEHRVGKSEYRREAAKLRRALLEAQYALRAQARFSVVVLIAGVQGAGRGDTVNLLNEWMDPRHVETFAFGPLSEDERERPEQWRYWNALPPKGKIGVLFDAWHAGPILRRVRGKTDDDAFAREIAQVMRFEQMLADEGVLLLKYWFHISAKQQKKRLEKAGEESQAPYGKFVRVSEAFLQRTSTRDAPWTLVPGGDRRHRVLTFAGHLLGTVRARLEARPRSSTRRTARPLAPDATNVIRALALQQPLARPAYKEALKEWQGRLNALSRKKRFQRLSVIGVFEGNDGAGKGGAIRRVTQALDARLVRTIAVGAPTEEERARPYLWRFWRHVPRRGHVVLFDRSWYGRVLVERVEGFAAEAEWRRAYAEINDFEHLLARHGIVVAKFWLAISREEQLRRFRERERVAHKRFKITPEDWRNRGKWNAYEAAACEMVDRTSSALAPWTLVEADNKRFARIKVLKTLCAAIERALD